jgi:hypothetical protein
MAAFPLTAMPLLPPLVLLPAGLDATRLATGWAIFQGLLIEALPFCCSAW